MKTLLNNSITFFSEPEVEAKPEETKKDETEEKQNKKEEGISPQSFRFLSFFFRV